MKVEYINPFIEATKSTFEAMTQIKPLPGKPVLEEEYKPGFDISGIIGLTGKVVGIVVLSFPTIMSLKIASIITGKEIKTVTDEVIDVIGELVNIICGNAKVWLSKYELSTSLPNVIKGENHTVFNPKNVPMIRIPFQTDIGEFSLHISFRECQS